ncbi:hypothetical protein MIND_01158900 [Mycena indigotica]|uniref:Uncharacterized protein n=1 Tax=Mycena indigotica TaxID=2126181 RepID=A0A8H6S3P7_9AGAR|nr:uncharacterized protein MIND_01158900 [Mycena indigotica]KAF7292610.1 hypothetical protein MIND_01158900 [Mycena indigotica]
MTEYDYSPEGYRQFQRTQERISNWADDTAQQAHKYKNPFLPRSDADFRGNEFYGKGSGSGSKSGSASSSRRHTPSGHHHHSSRSKPTRSYSQGVVAQPTARAPARSNTIAVSPHDSISQIGTRQRARSHSPSRHRSSSGKHHRSGTTTYVINPQPQYGYTGAPYVQSPGGYYAAPQPQPQAQPQPAAYVVYPRGKVQIVYPEPQQYTSYPPAAHPSQEHHSGFFSKIFNRSGSGSRRSRSLSRSRR